MYRKVKLSVIFFIIIHFLFIPYHNINTRELTINDIIEGYKLHISLIKSGKVNFTIEYSTTELGAKYEKEIQEEGIAPLLSSLYDVTYYFEGDKFRYNIHSKSLEWFWWEKKEVETRIYTEYIFDGETATRIDYRFDNIVAYLTDDPKDPLFPSMASIKRWGIELNDKPLSEAIESSNSKLIGFENLDRESFYIIQIKPPIDIGAEFRIWVNPKRGYLMQKMEAIQNGKTEASYTEENEFKEFSNGIWFPSKGVKILSSVENSKKKELSKTIMEVKDFQINIDIPDDVFKKAFDKGTVVHDRQTGEIYIVK